MKDKKEVVDILMDYINEHLSPEKHEQVGKMIETDSDIYRMYQLLKSLVRSGENTENQATINATRELSDKLFSDYTKTLTDKSSGWALPVYDSGIMPLPEGVRPAAVDTRRLKYKTDDLEIEISIYPTSIDLYDIVGQITGTSDIENCQVVLKSTRKKYTVETDSFFLFQLSKIQAGEYTVAIKKGKSVITHFDLSL